MNTKAIYFDMDGTIADLYGVENWLYYLQNSMNKPYREAKPLVDMRKLAKILNILQKNGYHIGIISWLSKNSTITYDNQVIKAKINWLHKHLGSVSFDEISIIPYGTPKSEKVQHPAGILFDDEIQNRENWNGTAYDVNNILDILINLI